MAVVRLGVLLTALLLLSSCGANGDGEGADPTPAEPAEVVPETADSVTVSEAEYGEVWPFTVSEGTVRCADGIAAVTFVADGETYALNGDAIGQGLGTDIREADIWRPGADVSPLIQRGLALCD